jgi:putative nucleotidyltransferase with HDIG domain
VIDRDALAEIESHVRATMPGQVAHDYKHADRVRRWAARIAKEEGYSRLDLVEAAALLHDIGRSGTQVERDHAAAGAEIASDYLRVLGCLAEEEIAEIVLAVRYHNAIGREVSSLQGILRDADILDMLGAMGIMRACTSKARMPEYDPEQVKGETWGLSNRDFAPRLASGDGPGPYIVDQINMQLSCAENMTTAAGRRFARPLVGAMRDFMVQLDSEINHWRER